MDIPRCAFPFPDQIVDFLEQQVVEDAFESIMGVPRSSAWRIVAQMVDGLGVARREEIHERTMLFP